MNPQAKTTRPSQASVHRPRSSARRTSRVLGFTVLEVLVAIGIFAVGFAAVAAIFPAAAILQRQTMDEVAGQGIDKSVQGLLTGRPFTTASLNSNQPNDLHLHMIVFSGVLPDWSSGPPDMSSGSPVWSMGDDLTFPSTSDSRIRRFSAYPLVRRKEIPSATADKWQVFAFIIRKVDTSNHPKPASIGVSGVTSPSYQGTFNLSSSLPQTYSIRVGDNIIDSHGTIHTVKSVSADSVTVTGAIINDPVDGFPNAIWYVPAPAADRVSPTLRIIGPLNAVKD